jgi:hypothetical protein
MRAMGLSMSSLVGLAESKKWDEIHAMLDRGEGDVNERDQGRPSLTARF